MLLNKVDLADPKATKEWTEFFTKKGITVLAIDSKSGKGNKKLISTVERLSKPIICLLYTSSKGGTFMRYSYKFKKKAIELSA